MYFVSVLIFRMLTTDPGSETMSDPLFEPDFADVDAETMAAFRAFKRATMLHRRLLMSAFADSDLHPAQAMCLRALAHSGGLSQSDLAGMLHVSRPTVTMLLKRMEAAGTVERRPDATDSRVTRVYLTEAGIRQAETMRAAFSDLLGVSLGTLAGADKRELTRILETMNAGVEETLRARGVGPWQHPGSGRRAGR